MSLIFNQEIASIYFNFRLSVYLIPVLLVSILLNIPKFLETEFISQRVPIDEG